MQTSSFNDWNKGIFSVVGKPGGPPTTETTRWYRRDQPDVEHNGFYGVDDISYVWNEHGFRSDEFVEGAESILVMGCSYTLGMGVPVEHTWGSLLRDKINPDARIYNLSMAATSSDYISRALHKTLDTLRPSAVCILWPAVSSREVARRNRYLHFKAFAFTHDVVNDEYKIFEPLKEQLLDVSYIKYQNVKNQIFCENLCKSAGIPFCSMPMINDDIFFKEKTTERGDSLDTGKAAQTVAHASYLLGKEFNFPLARDNVHFGLEWNQWVASEFESKLRLGGL